MHLQWQGQGLGLYYNNGTVTGLKNRMTIEILVFFFLKKKRGEGVKDKREEVKNELRNEQTDFNWLSFRTWKKKGFKLWSLKNCYNHEPKSIISNKEAQKKKKNTHLKKRLLFWTCAHLFLNDSTPMNETALLGSLFSYK